MLARARRRRSSREQARKAEALGYSTLFVPDHFVEHRLAPIAGARATAAAVTDTLRVGPLVLGNDYKHPVVLAREMATLDLLSDGRLELGIGAGWMTADYEKAGIPLDRPGVRIARLAESITILKGLFADGPVHVPRRALPRHRSRRAAEAGAAPASAVHHRRRAAARSSPLAAREAQIVGINANLRVGRRRSATTPRRSMTGAATDEKIAWLREAAGDRFDDLEIQTLVGFVHVTDDRRSGMAEVMAGAFGVAPEDDAWRRRWCWSGRSRSMIDDVLERGASAGRWLHRRASRRHGARSRRSSRDLAGT